MPEEAPTRPVWAGLAALARAEYVLTGTGRRAENAETAGLSGACGAAADEREHLVHRAGGVGDRELHRADGGAAVDQEREPLEAVRAARPEDRQQQPRRELVVLVGQEGVRQPRVRD